MSIGCCSEVSSKLSVTSTTAVHLHPRSDYYPEEMASASSNHKLVEISRQNWEELRDLFLVDWPENILGYSIVNNFVEFQKRKGDNVDINHLKFYSLDGAWRNEGAFLIIVRISLFLKL